MFIYNSPIRLRFVVSCSCSCVTRGPIKQTSRLWYQCDLPLGKLHCALLIAIYASSKVGFSMNAFHLERFVSAMATGQEVTPSIVANQLVLQSKSSEKTTVVTTAIIILCYVKVLVCTYLFCSIAAFCFSLHVQRAVTVFVILSLSGICVAVVFYWSVFFLFLLGLACMILAMSASFCFRTE